MSGDLGRLVLQFAADVAGFQSDLGRVERAAERSARETARAYDRAVTGITSSIKSAALAMGAALAAAFTVDAIKDLVKGAIDLSDKINDVSKKTGVTTESLSGLRFAAEQSGVEFDQLATSLIKVQQNALSAASGNEKLKGIFTALGVSVTDASGRVKASDVLFKELAGSLGGIQDVTIRNAAGVEIFGKSFTKLIPFLKEGEAGIAALIAEAERLGIIISGETAQAAEDFNDQLDKIKSSVSGVGLSMAAELLPVLIEAAEGITEFVIQARETGALKEFAAGVAQIVQTLFDITAAVIDARDNIVDFVKVVGNVSGVSVAIAAYERLARAVIALRGESKGAAPGADASGPKAGKGGVTVDPVEVAKGVKVTNDLAAALRAAGIAGAGATPKARAFVEAVKVLGINKEPVGVSKELAAAISKIRDELDPTRAITRQYEQDVKNLTAATAADSAQRGVNERTLKALKVQYDANIAAARASTTVTVGVIESLQREAGALKGSAFDRQELAKALRIETAYRDALAQAIQENGKVTDEEKKKIRELVEEIDKLANKKTFNFAGAFSDAINEGFAKGSLTAGFKNFIKQIKDAFEDGPEGIAGVVTSVANGLSAIIQAAENSDGNSTGAGVRAGVSLLADAGNVFAQAALAIDTLFKGKLFGTDFARQSQTNSSTFGAAGFAGNVQTVDTRQRSLFRGTATRTTNTAVDASAQEAGAAFQRALDDIARTISDAFGTDLSERVNASFVQKFDKNGALVSTIATVAGRAVAAGTQQAFEQFLTAQTIIDALKPSIEGLDALADPFRAAGLTLLEFAQFAFAAQTDLAQGFELLGPDSGFAQILPVIEGLSRGGESLAETYKRVRDGAQLFDEALATIGATSTLARLDFVKFTAELTVALGGLNRATEIIGRNIAEFFTPTELRATRLTGAQSTLAGLGESTGLGLLSAEAFKALLTEALAGGFDAARTADILAYGDALATVNGLVRETTAANEAAAQADADRAAAIIAAQSSLDDFVLGLQDAAGDGSLTNYQRQLRALYKQFETNAATLTDLARQAGLTQAPIAGVTANLSLLAQGSARALADLKVSVLQGLQSLFGGEELTESQRNAAAFNELVYGNARATNNWAEQLKELETLQATQDLARNIADLFGASGLSFAQGVEQYGLPLRDLLQNLGVDFQNLTDPASIAAFGAAAGLLGVSAGSLAELAGVDLSGLSEAQQTALEVASAPQLEAVESSANSLLNIDEKSTSIITQLMQQNATAREQNERLSMLGDKFTSLSDEVRRLANRVPSA